MRNMLLPGVYIFSLGLSGAAVSAMQFPYQSCFQIASQQSNIALDLLMAVAAVESNWDADARSSANAHGLMQIRWPLTAHHLGAGRVAELYNPCLNISMGASYLRELSERYQGNQSLMLAAYNYGPSRIKTEADIPKSVRGYVNRVNKHRKKIIQKMQKSIPEGLQSAGVIEVNRFDSTIRAKQYLKALLKKVPEANFSLRRSKAGESIVYLDTNELSSAARYRLVALLPKLKG